MVPSVTMTAATPLGVQSTTSTSTSIQKTTQAPKILAPTHITTAVNIPKTLITTASSQQIPSAMASTKPYTVINTVKQVTTKPPAMAPLTTNVMTGTSNIKVAIPPTLAKTTATLSSQNVITAQTAMQTSQSITSAMATKPSLVSVVSTPPIPVHRVTKPVSTPVVNALKTPLVSSTIPSTSYAAPKVSLSVATPHQAPIISSSSPKTFVSTPPSTLTAALATRLTSTSQTSTALSVNGNFTSNPANYKHQPISQQRVKYIIPYIILLITLYESYTNKTSFLNVHFPTD
jgi:hypothetical protein